MGIIPLMKKLLFSISLLGLGIIIGFSVASSQKTKNEVTQNAGMEQSVIDFFSQPTIGRLAVNLNPEYGSTIIDAEPIWTLPEEPDEDFPTGHLDGIKPFDENEGFDNLPLFSQSEDPNAPPKWRETVFDIDGDYIPEKIMINNLTMTSQPHLIRIVKDDMVVFEFAGSVVSVEEVYGNQPWGKELYQPGFILTTQTWQQQNGHRVRYVISDDGGIVPLWQQRHAGIEFVDSVVDGAS